MHCSGRSGMQVMTARAATPWLNRIVGHADVPPADLVPNPRNWRSHPAEQQRALTGALAEVGWVAEVLVNRTTGHVVDGHLRVELALDRDEATVPVTFVELSEEEERLVLATLDPLAAMAEAEKDQLAALLADLEPGDEALRALLGDLGRDAGIDSIRSGLVDPDDVPHAPDEPTVKLGELYALVTTGSSAATPPMPPPTTVSSVRSRRYGVHRPALERRDRPGLEPSPSPTPRPDQRLPAGRGFTRLLRASPATSEHAYRRRLLHPRCIRVAHARSLAPRGGVPLERHDHLVKDPFVLGRSNYHRRYEPLWYGWPDDGPSSYVGGRAQDDVWEIPRPRRSEVHPTMKPVELVARAIANSSVSGQIVLDPFLGSGSTLIAAEQTGRRGYGMELDPRYAQVAIERWEAFTGRSAELSHGS